MNYFIQRHSKGNSARFALVIPFLLIFALLSAQTIALQHDHNHDGELTHQLDCSICFKQGSQSFYIGTDYLIPQLVKASTQWQIVTPAKTFNTPLTANSRAPPLI